MSKPTVIRKDTLTDIAEAIREKTETTELIPTVEMAQRIRDIETLPTDATAVSEDLLAGKVAYNNDGRFVGSIEEFTGGFEEDSTKTDIDIYKQLIEGTIEVFDLDMEIDTIGKNAFSNCMNLKKIYLSKNIKYILEDCFFNCIALKDIYLYNNNEMVQLILGLYSFYSCSNITIHVPQSLLSNYLSSESWIHLIQYKNFSIVGDL